MEWWILELITAAAMFAIVGVLGPLIGLLGAQTLIGGIVGSA